MGIKITIFFKNEHGCHPDLGGNLVNFNKEVNVKTRNSSG